MSKRLTPARTTKAPMLSLRLPEDLQAALVGVKDALARATPGLEPSLSDAVRVLLREALAARATPAAAPPAAADAGAPGAVQREGQRGRQEGRRDAQVAHTAADGQLNLLSRIANDTTVALPAPVRVPSKTLKSQRASRALDADELRRLVVATGASTRVIAAATGVGKSAVAKFMGGGPAGATVLAALAGFVSQAQP